MFDARLQPWLRRGFAPLARGLAARGVTADAVTLAGFAVGVAATIAVGSGAPAAGLVLLLLNRCADGLDGALARHLGPTDRGAFLDIALDFAVYALFPLGFAFADPARNALAAAVLIASFIGTGSSFLAFAAVAAGRNMTAETFPTKGIYYLGGLTEGAETILAFAAMALWPNGFAAIAWTFAGLCGVTTITRWRQGWVAFSGNSRASSQAAASIPKGPGG
jgi:phosphatidylglycerophosphate synthase